MAPSPAEKPHLILEDTARGEYGGGVEIEGSEVEVGCMLDGERDEGAIVQRGLEFEI